MRTEGLLERRALGKAGIEVSRMCLGTLTVGDLQMRMEPEKAADIFEAAYDMGVNFFDSAMIYGSHPHLAAFLRRVPRDGVVLATKSYDFTYEGMRKSVEKALFELGTDYIDIYMMHEQESRSTLIGHTDGFRCLEDCRKQGLIRAIGVSTHACEVVEVAPELDFIDVLHPMFNHQGLGLIDGAVERMGLAISKAHKAGIGIYAMKVLGGGLLIDGIKRALTWAISNDDLDSIALGIASKAELELDVAIFNGRMPDDFELAAAHKRKSIVVEEWCEGCGTCLKACQQGAISIVGGHSVVDRSKCVLCGYCGKSCPGFHIRVV